MEGTNKLIEKVLSYKTWSDKKKIDKLLEHDCSMYTNLGIDSTKTEVLETKKKSRAIYRAIGKIDKKQGESYLWQMDKQVLIQRETYLIKTFDRLHDKLNDVFESVSDGNFEDSRNSINSLIFDLKELKKNTEP